jgi:fimbrial chaperone protein
MRASLTAAVLLAACVATAGAGSLRVTPVLLDVRTPASAATLTLRNDAEHPLNVQIRVFRWTQANGAERLERTTEVVVSPPMATFAPGMEYVVRVVRPSKRPVIGEESYRILVDEVPDPTQQKSGEVHFVLRYSIPVFFAVADAPRATVAWSARLRGGAVTLTAANSGGRRLRLANLKLVDASGATVLQHDGLVGYVLNGSSMSWSFGGGRSRFAGSIKLAADSESGSIHATVPIAAVR